MLEFVVGCKAAVAVAHFVLVVRLRLLPLVVVARCCCSLLVVRRLLLLLVVGCKASAVVARCWF